MEELSSGTGANHKKTLGLFKDNFIEGDVGEVRLLVHHLYQKWLLMVIAKQKLI